MAIRCKQRRNCLVKNHFQGYNHTQWVSSNNPRTRTNLGLVEGDIKIDFDIWISWGIPLLISSRAGKLSFFYSFEFSNISIYPLSDFLSSGLFPFMQKLITVCPDYPYEATKHLALFIYTTSKNLSNPLSIIHN